MARHKKHSKKNKRKGIFSKGISSIKKTTGRVIPGITNKFKSIGSNVIKTTGNVAKSGTKKVLNDVGLSKSKKRKGRSIFIIVGVKTEVSNYNRRN